MKQFFLPSQTIKAFSEKALPWPRELLWRSALPLLPAKPGVYWFRNEKKKILYVGKAKNLKQRVRSYSNRNLLSPKINRMVREAREVKFSETASEFDALLVEAELIRLHQPAYNTQHKDDKSPLYIYFTNDEIPLIRTGRWDEIDIKSRKNSLFGPYQSGYGAKYVLSYARKLFPFCSATKWQLKRNRACFYYHLGMCPGICVGKISREEYLERLTYLRIFLKGKRKALLVNLNKKLKDRVKVKDFEAAVMLRDQIKLLEPKVSLVNRLDLELPMLLEEKSLEQLVSLKRVLRSRMSLPGDYPLERIEGYDISNTSGELATGSMVVYTNGRPDKNEYKKFRIKTITGPDDAKMMAEVLGRRLKHTEWPMPQLILVDGGKGQLLAAKKVMGNDVPMVGLAKKPDRLVFFSKSDGKYFYLKLNEKYLWSQLLASLRDESHRFAKSYHKHLRLKSLAI